MNSTSIYSNAKSVSHSITPPCTPTVYTNERNLGINDSTECNLKEKSANNPTEQILLTEKMLTSQLSNEIDSIHPIIQHLKSKLQLKSHL